MTTKMYPVGAVLADCHRGSADSIPSILRTTPGTVKVGYSISGTQAGPAQEQLQKGGNLEFLSQPLAADATISGTVTMNIWAFESNMSANVGVRILIERLDSQLAIASTILDSAKGVEAATAAAVNNWTGTPTSTAMNRGDRIRVTIWFKDAGGTQAAGFTATADLDGPTAAADGDSWVQFNENLTFETSDPAGTKMFMLSAAASGGINPGSANELEAWTSRGGGSVNSVTSSVNGPTAPIQITATAGGTLIEWYSRPLNAFTLGGKALFNVRAVSAGFFASMRAEIAVVANDGTGPTVWGAADVAPPGGAAGNTEGFIDTTEASYSIYVSGDDLAVTAGQRLRFRLYIDDRSDSGMSTGSNVTTSYNGASAAATGDTWVQIPQSITEQTTPASDVPLPAARRLPFRQALLTR